ncbi:MAG TPA: SUMF1/EgtB/PvdO family nonheme iron enzyme [Myxococcaceae bacterium]|nr:SUMF1/EgtB/PvdO family nonheme iron enzyme [Myxococcaceae bacterium]
MASPASSTPPDSWTPPEEFDEYRLIRLIGRGRTGRVFLAHDTLLERPVAVKFIPALGQNALARFLVEARAAARIQHPNVVTLYRVGQLEDQPYLISEFIRGVSLDRLAKPVASERALGIGKDLARGLSAAHRRGVLHRDIKPGNAVLTESGEVKLLDFGLAKLLDPNATESTQSAPARPPTPPELPSEMDPEASPGFGARSLDGVFLPSLPRGALVGTPYYMSPEAWAGEELTARSDVYSLGVILYELCAGKGPFRDVAWRELSEVVRTRDAKPLAEAAPGVEPGFAAVIDRCLRREPFERYASAAALLDALEQLGRDETAAGTIPEGNPYRGLQAFEAEHRALFFGRRREQRAVLERLKGEPFLLITGDSGVGKSSLCLAGVMPLIGDGALEDGRRWRSVRLVPGRRPVAALAAALAPVLEEEEEQLAHFLRAEPMGLARKLRAKLGAKEGLLLYMDQLEELVTLSSPEEAAPAGLALGELAEGVTGVRLLATGRSDFLTRLTSVPGLGAEVPRALYLLRALTPEEMREAIVGPARVKGVRFENEALVDTLVASTSTTEGGLPLLQFALAELWDARDKTSGVITQAALDGLGGVAGALAKHADAAVDSLLPDQRVAARGVLLRLITADGTRARKTDRELVGDDPRYRAALEALVRARLLVAREAEEGTSYEVAHEALVTGWKTLARWLVEAAERRDVQARLEAAAAHWERLGHARDVLWNSRQLVETAVLDPGELTRREQDFLEASRRTVVRNRRVRRALAAGFLVLLSLVYGGGRLRERWQLNEQVQSRLDSASQALVKARQEREALSGERNEAFEHYNAGRKKQGDKAWAHAKAERARVYRSFDLVGGQIEHALLLAPERRDVRALLVDYLYERALLEEQEGALASLPTLLQRMEIYDTDGRRWRQWNEPAHLTVVVATPGARLELRSLSRDANTGRAVVGALVQPVPQSWQDVSLKPGNYWLTAEAPGHEPATLPLRVTRGQRQRVELPLLAKGQVPQGFVYVPPGQSFFGSAAEDSVREFFNSTPIHEVSTPGFFIARHETTFADWIAFMDALPPDVRARHVPSVGNALHGQLHMEHKDGVWHLSMKPSSTLYKVRAGDKLRYAKRDRRQVQDWLRMPVAGIDFASARAYAQWLADTGRVPGARLCSELEWERAARGVDGREYPHGDSLEPDDANYDLTYGKEPDGFGPDEVGSHPTSRSPFGVDDMVGNVWEWTYSFLEAKKPVARGGSYYYAASSGRSANRELPEPSLRDHTVGMRVCADLGAAAVKKAPEIP